uniref:Uncharacterized protein n=1 Tax=Octopus bimaculoides TaxID=37653 RepID=A0A0L8GK18_OCTBM
MQWNCTSNQVVEVQNPLTLHNRLLCCLKNREQR